jgi:chloramphenicol 3-O-phosphotransferase
MILLLNGSFGIGKTTVARAIVSRLSRSVLFDPELIGMTLQRIPRLRGPVEDFQDLASWRRLSIAGIRITRGVFSNVVVPMTFTNRAYLEEIRRGVAAFEPNIFHVCLVAPLPIVEARLRARGADRVRNAWEFRRAAECCDAHRSPDFSRHVDASERTTGELADAILDMLPDERRSAA